MPVTKILIRLTTLDASQGSTGTSDPLYLGVLTKFGGREFPLRYQRSGLSIGVGQTLEFGINASDLPQEKQIYNSTGDGPNSINAFPLNTVERVYLRKEPVSAGADRDAPRPRCSRRTSRVPCLSVWSKRTGQKSG